LLRITTKQYRMHAKGKSRFYDQCSLMNDVGATDLMYAANKEIDRYAENDDDSL